jgi:hypothetical protein
MSPTLRWAITIVAAVALVAMLAWARNGPGVGGRFPHPEDVHMSPTTQP